MGKRAPKTPERDVDPYLVPGLRRGLDVLQAFSPDRPRLTLGEMAAAVGTTRSAIFRIVYTLSKAGVLEQDRATQTYRLGPGVLRLGRGYPVSRDLVDSALPELEALRDRTGWSTHLGVLAEQRVIYLLRLPVEQQRLSLVSVGCRLPAHATAMGRVLLSHLTEPEVVARFRETPLTHGGPKAPANLPEVLHQARGDAKRGFVAHMGHFEPGVASVSAALRDSAGGVIAAINCARHLSEADQGLDWQPPMVEAVLEAAVRITQRLQAMPPQILRPPVYA